MTLQGQPLCHSKKQRFGTELSYSQLAFTSGVVGGDRMTAGIILTLLGLAMSVYAVVAHHYPQLPKLSLWVIALLITWMALGYDIYDRHHGHDPSDYKNFARSGPLEKIYAHVYANETIEVDGRDFDHCTFENVTFISHGLAAWSFEVATFKGDTFVQTDNQAAKSFTTLMTWIQHQEGVTAVGVGMKDANGNVSIQSFDKQVKSQQSSSGGDKKK